MIVVIQHYIGKVNPHTKLIYPVDVVQRAIERSPVIYGTLGMPKPDKHGNFTPVSKENASHRFTNLQIVGTELRGEVIVEDNPDGLLLSENLYNVSFRAAEHVVVKRNTVTEDRIVSINAVPKGD
jgi:hypothetical protein